VLLLKKAEGLWGGGKWNAPGGRLLPDEDPKQGAIRELQEETGLEVEDPKQLGVLTFYFGEGSEPDWVVYVFRAGTFKGTLRPSREGHLKWHSVDALPYDEMWEDDRHWVPLMLEGKRFRGEFHFDKEAKKLLRHRIEVLEELEPSH
jgi:8-oxo-dGTP diphosphatase